MAQGHSKVSIPLTVVTDVIVLIITAAQCLTINELWVTFGVGKNFRYFADHRIARAVGSNWCVALSMFPAFTECDTLSFFSDRDKIPGRYTKISPQNFVP